MHFLCARGMKSKQSWGTKELRQWYRWNHLKGGGKSLAGVTEFRALIKFTIVIILCRVTFDRDWDVVCSNELHYLSVVIWNGFSLSVWLWEGARVRRRYKFIRRENALQGTVEPRRWSVLTYTTVIVRVASPTTLLHSSMLHITDDILLRANWSGSGSGNAPSCRVRFFSS